ncbi:hypothetical protein [Pseudomonas sp. Marseille-Q1929]|uniref:hypothetical protein n=1 Tax=Pseudomonas sp. Marseille-Q1929 TaxID=2730402 RepID=UPI001A8F949A|nr:hypothetical protein [Pseudomonas sp. Marseille-Q1929]MBO0496206.1 hypothetical protein [Pseudomonas sp. Marseille-Q1929]
MTESKVKKAISIRFDPAEYASYAAMVESAEMSVSDGLRLLVAEKLAQAEQVDMTGLEICCQFKWKAIDSAFPEHVANLLLEVKAPGGISEGLLQRLVFVLPEFWTDAGYEHLRIDSAYFHRVTDDYHYKTSTKAKRNVMSFHLIDSHWRGAVFDYGSGLSRQAREARIIEALTAHISQTIRCYLIDHLPTARVLPEELHREMISVYDKEQITNLMKL